MPYTIYDLIPGGINWFKNEADWAQKAPGQPAPRNPTKPTKLWRDPSPIYSNPFGFWGAVSGAALEYNFFARTPEGKIALTPIDRNNPLFTSTYNYTVVNTLTEHAYMFPQGVPYIVKKALSPSEAVEINVAGNPQLAPIDYPVRDGSFVFIVTPSGDSVIAYDYQEFLQMAKPPKMNDEDRVILVGKIVNTSGMTPTNKIGAIRKAITDYYPSFIIT